MTNQASGIGTRGREITDRVWVGDRPLKLDRQGLQDE